MKKNRWLSVLLAVMILVTYAPMVIAQGSIAPPESLYDRYSVTVTLI